MIPGKLTVSGFLSYQQPAVLDFSGLHVACITGQNGAGKSAMLDAITWALFGEARKNDDSIINDVCPEQTAKVEFEFSYEGARYLVRRSKARGKPNTAEFYIRNEADTEWKALTEKRVADTNRRICATLRMDYKTFINASFFLQGKADQFTGQNATERKKILSTILNLDVWESCKAKAIEKRKESENAAAYLKKLMDEADEELKNEENLRRSLAEIEEQVRGAEKRRDDADAKWNLAKTAESSLLSLKNILDQKQRDEQRQERLVRNLETTLRGLEDELESVRKRLKNAETVEQNYTRLLSLRDQLEKLNAAGMASSRLETRRTALRSDIRNRENQLKYEQAQLIREKDDLDRRISECQQLRERLEADRRKSASLTELCAQLPSLREEVETVKERGGQYKSEFLHLDEKEREISGKLERLLANQGALCPTCGRELDEAHCRTHAAELNQQIEQVRKERNLKENERAELRNRFSVISKEIRQLDEMAKELADLNVGIRTGEQKIRTVDEQVERWEREKKNRLTEVENTLRLSDFCPEERQELARVEESIRKLNYDRAAHEAANESMKQLSGAEKAHLDLIADRSRLEPLERELENRTRQLDEDRKQLNLVQDERKKAAADWQIQYAQMPDLQAIEAERNNAAQLLSRLNREEGGIRQRAAHLEQARENLNRYGAEFREKTALSERYKSLEKAFGKDGIPALLIEQAVPEIEEQANKILQQLSNGAMSLRMNTQTNYKSKKDEVKETLEILISDPYGVREYEMFSGGEAFRINFSIRLALSRILAQRAGSRLQTLVIDEGFGSQDDEGRARLAEAITAVQDDFEKILVITHLTELKEAFPARIEVEKTASGSRMEVVL